MTPTQYCYEKVAPRGSMIYLSVRGLSLQQRDAIVAIWAFYREIEEITLSGHDPAVCQAKLNWWRDEVIKIQDAQPDHPVAKMLQQVAVPVWRLIFIIEGLEQNLALPLFATFADVVVHVMRTAGQRELLIAEVLGGEVNAECVYQLTLVVELTYYLQHLRQFVRRGLIYFAQDELQQFGVSNEFQTFTTTAHFQEFLSYQAGKIDRAYQQALSFITNHQPLIHLLPRCCLALEIVKVLREEKFAVLEKFIDVSPLRRWWVMVREFYLARGVVVQIAPSNPL